MLFKKISIMLLVVTACFSLYAEVSRLSEKKDDNQQEVYGSFLEKDDWDYCQKWVTCPGTRGCRVFISGERDDCSFGWDYCRPRILDCRADDGGMTCEILCDQV